MTTPEPPISPIDDLVEHLRVLNLSSSLTSLQWIPDDHLPSTAITTAFDLFLMDLIMLQSAFQSPRFRGIIGGAWNGFKMKLLVSLCEPYRKAMSGMENKIERLSAENTSKTTELATKVAEIARLSAENNSKTIELATKVGEITRLSAENGSKTIELATKVAEITRLSTENNSKTIELASRVAEITRLSAENSSKNFELATKVTEITRLTAENSLKTIVLAAKVSEITRLSAENSSNTIELATKVAQIERLSTENNSKTIELATNVAEITRLSAENNSITIELNRKVAESSQLTVQLAKLRSENDYLHGENLSMGREMIKIISKKPHPDGVPATITRAKTWQEVMDDDYNRMEELLPRLDNLIRASDVTNLGRATYHTEPAMYNRVQRCFAKHLTTPESDGHPGAKVLDTHNIQVIQGLKPDISIIGATRPRATATGIIAAVEMKVGALTRDSFGQLYAYLKGIQHAQPSRRIVIGLLSNLSENRFLTLERSPGNRTRCLRYQSVPLNMALTFLRDVVVLSPLYHPPTSLFSPDIGKAVVLLGNPIFSTVGEFRIPAALTRSKFRNNRWVDPNFKARSGDVCMVVKRTTPGVYSMSFASRAPRSVRNEIKILRRILDRKDDDDNDLPAGGHLPRILFHDNSFAEFGILPRGQPIHPSNPKMDWATVVVNVLDALKWLHGIQIIHRDVRLDNIVWDNDHAVLIDLGTAVDMSQNAGSAVSFVGGYVCCPPGIIGQLDNSYMPKPADDCLAVVLLVNTVLFPARWEHFRSAELEKPGSHETKILAQFWENVAVSSVWEGFFKAACEADYGALKKMVEFFVYL